MTQEQILGNKLIASWMGYKTWVAENGTVMAEDDLTYAGHLSHFKCFQYHSDWNLLMPVVEKINKFHTPNYYDTDKATENDFSLSYSIDTDATTFVVHFKCFDSSKHRKTKYFSANGNGINVVYEAILQFITWYNEQLASISTENIFNEAAAQFPNTLKKLPDTEKPEMHILYNPTGQKEYHEERKERTLDREKMTRTEASKRNAVLRDSGSDNWWILDITAWV